MLGAVLPDLLNNDFSADRKKSTHFIKDHSHISGMIKPIISELNDFSGNSEKTFLDIGGRLKTFHDESKTLTEIASQAASTVSDEILTKAIFELSQLLNEISSLFVSNAKEIRNNKEELIKTFEKLRNIGEELEGFDRIVKRLKIFGISTKIESSRLSIDDSGFLALAENVDKLSAVISEKISAIGKKSRYLLDELKQTIGDLEKLEHKQQEQSESILTKTVTSLEKFKEKNEEFSQKIEIISLGSKGVTENINSIVAAIQFHDITRQQMEHVKEALHELVQNNFKIPTAEEEKDNYGTIYNVCQLQSAQLSNSLNEFVSAVTDIIENLTGVGENINSILSQSYDLLCDDNSSKTSCLKNFEQELDLISNGLKKNLDIEDELTNSIKSILGIVDDLSKNISEIEEVGGEIEIIALNARIKSAHFGSDGAALGVLAESIQKLSAEAKEHTISTSKVLSDISDESEKLKNDLANDYANSSSKGILANIEKISQLTASMHQMEDKSGELMNKMKHIAGRLNSNLNATSSGITIHLKAQKVIEASINTLEEITENLAGDIDMITPGNTLNLESRYTMHSERKVHQDFAKGTDLSNNNKNVDQSDDLLFGDNIELF